MDSRTHLLCYSLQNTTSLVFWTAVMLLCSKPAQLTGGPVLQAAPHAEKASLVSSRTELEEAERHMPHGGTYILPGTAIQLCLQRLGIGQRQAGRKSGPGHHTKPRTGQEQHPEQAVAQQQYSHQRSIPSEEWDVPYGTSCSWGMQADEEKYLNSVAPYCVASDQDRCRDKAEDTAFG